MRVTVTGGAGFIGSNLVRALGACPEIEDLTVVDDLSTGRASNLDGLQVRLVTGSILDADVLDDVVRRVDAVVHLAARPSVPRSLADPVSTHEANATGTVRVLEAARRHDVGHVVVASSSSVYGDTPTLPKHEEQPPAPRSPYAASKLAAEVYALAYGHSFGLPTLAFRFFNVYGPLQAADHAYAAVIPRFVAAALEGRALPIHGDGHQTRDFTYVGSVCDVLVEALRRRVVHPGPVNLAFGSRRSILEVADELAAVLGRDLEVVHGPPRVGDVRDSQASERVLRKLFPTATPVGFREALRTTVEWSRSVMA